jgi:hypothetical protein
LDALESQLLVAVTLPQVAHREQNRIFRLLLSLLHLFKQFWVKHLKSGNTDALGALKRLIQFLTLSQTCTKLGRRSIKAIFQR